MHKNIFGRQFKRDTNERKALFKGLMTSLVMHDRIQTTEEKAKAVKGSVEKLVTKAKKKGMLAFPQLLPYLHEDAVKRMITDIAPRFTDRPGGYTRIIKLGKRFGDNASVVIMEWVEASRKTEAGRQKTENGSRKTEKVENTIVKETKGPKKSKEQKKTEKPKKVTKRSE